MRFNILVVMKIVLPTLFQLLSHEKDSGLFTKKRQMLQTLFLWSPDSGNTLESALLVFRIAYFSRDDLLVCQKMSVEDISKYRNPCNARKAYKALRAANPQHTVELDAIFGPVLFRPNFTQQGLTISAPADLFPSLAFAAPMVSLVNGKYDYSLVANREFNFGDSVISLDANLPISLLSAFRDPESFPGVDLFEQGLHPDIVFMLYLIHLRDRLDLDSVWGDFFRIQPANYGTLFELPIEVVEALGEPELTGTVIEQNNALRSIAASLHPSPAFADILWAKSLCTSRGFSLPIKPISEIEERIIKEYYPDGNLTTLLPLIHFLNHDFRAQCDTPVVDPITGAVELKASGKIEKGDEIFILYGGMNNKEFMLNYGFFVSGNPYDQILRPDGSLVRRGATSGKLCACSEWESVEHSKFTTLVNGYSRDRFTL